MDAVPTVELLTHYRVDIVDRVIEYAQTFVVSSCSYDMTGFDARYIRSLRTCRQWLVKRKHHELHADVRLWN